MNWTKEQLYGFGSSLMACLLIWLFLKFVFLQTEIRAEPEGVFIELGDVERVSDAVYPASSGRNEQMPDPEAEPYPESATSELSALTQAAEQTAEMEAKRQREEQEQQFRDIDRQMKKNFGGENASNDNQGPDVPGSDKQQSLQGTHTYDLSGRSLRNRLPRPPDNYKEIGTIVVEITVNPQGDVIDAKVHPRGTNIGDADMRRSAVEAAKKAKFSKISGNREQSGTITYNYQYKLT